MQFEPGSQYRYCNTNYVLLALIADELTGDHAQYITDIIFKPLGLTHTYYRNAPGYLNYPALYNAYWDRHSNSIVENVSRLQRNNVAALTGDDGIVATPEDAILFLKGLMEGDLISPATLKIMKSWVTDDEGTFLYGLGLDYAEFNGEIAYGHSGGGIGAGCQLYYFPEKDIYLFAGINLSTVTESPIHQEALPFVNELFEILLK